jgi:PHD/YefM family antitoxin component YafN of YafNO toxin-antitoxin module
MYDAMTATKMLNSFVPISRFNKGEAGKIIEEVKRDGIKVIVKNNAPECVMLSVEAYEKLVMDSLKIMKE